MLNVGHDEGGSDHSNDSGSDSHSDSGSGREGDASSLSNGADAIGGIFRAAQRAGKTGSIAAVEMLLAQGASPDTTDERGRTLLMIAAANGNTALTALLLKAGASVDATDDRGLTALMQAVDWPDSFTESKANNVTRRLVCVNALLAAGANVNARDATGWTPLMFASQHTKLWATCSSYVCALLANSADVNATNADGFTALMIAVINANDYSEIVLHLLAGGADVNAALPGCGTTSLMMAARKNRFWLVGALLRAGADVDAADSEGNTALMAAVSGRPDNSNREEHVASALLRGGADVNATNHAGHTPLMIAARHNPSLADILLPAGANVNAVAPDGSTALMFLAQASWCVDCRRSGVGSSVDPGDLPAQALAKMRAAAAAAAAQVPVLEALLAEAKADAQSAEARCKAAQSLMAAALAPALKAAEEAGWKTLWQSPLCGLPRPPPPPDTALKRSAWKLFEVFAAADEQASAATKELSAANLLASRAAGEARTAAWKAKHLAEGIEPELAYFARSSASCRARVIRALVRAGASVNAQNVEGETALMIATYAQHEYAYQSPAPRPTPFYESITSALIDSGADVEATIDDGWTPLISAAREGHTVDVQTLLAHGADTEAVGDFGDTALHHAAQQGHLSVVSTLLAAGANERSTNDLGHAPLHDAILSGHAAVATMFLVRGPLLLTPP